jgi:uncharacterized heparinase superfamily protein
VADGITRDPAHQETDAERAAAHRASASRRGARPGNQRPHLIWPRLQMLFAEPAGLLVSQARRKLLQPLYRSGPYRLSLGRVGPGDFLTPFDAPPYATPWPADSQAGQALLSGEFRFSGETIREPRPLSRPTGATPAWRQGIDRFDWLNDLRAAGAPGAQAAAIELTRRWLGENLRYREEAWRADVLAARLRNLLLNSGYLITGGDAGFKALLMGSLYRQASHLGRALPDGLYGAALLEAVIALMLAGLMLPRGEKLLV